jgi:hypothetical protein
MKYTKVLAINNSFYIAFVIFLFHFLFIDYSLVNDEYIFVAGSKFINTFEKKIIEIYFNYNSNTLGFSLIISILNNLFFFLDPQYIAKLLTYSGIIFLYFGLKKFIKYFNLKEKEFSYFYLLIIFNPVVWTYSFRGIPDFFSFTLAYFSIFSILNNKKNQSNFFYIFLFAISIVLKPFNGILLLFLFYDILIKKNYESIIYLIFLILVTSIYFFIQFNFFNFILIPPSYSSTFEVNFSNFLSSTIAYVGFSFLFISLLFSNYIIKKIRYIKNLLYILTLLFISFIISDNLILYIGELDFGFLQKIIDIKIYKSILLFSFLIFISIIFWERNKLDKILLVTIIVYFCFIFIMSLTHIAQRYLMIIIPLLYVLGFKLNSSIYEKKFLIIISIFLNIIAFGNYYNNNLLIRETLNFLNINNLLSVTSPGYIGQHSLDKFTSFYEKQDNKVIILTKNEIFKENKIYNISTSNPKSLKIVFKKDSNYIGFIDKSIYVLRTK